MTHHAPGFLLVMEGIDGAGKTTLANLLQERLQKMNFAVVRSKEPTAGRWGQILRDSAVTGRLSLEEEVETFLKDRREHVESVIAPALREGKIVILDRYYFSTMAYQGARGMDPNELMRRNEAFAPEPDLLVLLDIDPRVGLTRVKSRGDTANLFEKSDSLMRAREIFNAIKKPYVLRLDATQGQEASCSQILEKFRELKSTPKL